MAIPGSQQRNRDSRGLFAVVLSRSHEDRRRIPLWLLGSRALFSVRRSQMFCPVCKLEYRPGFTRCSDCSNALVEILPPEDIASLPGTEAVRVHFLAYVLPAIFMIYLVILFSSFQKSLGSPRIVLPFFLLIFASNCGSFWMLYQSLKYERKPLHYVLLAMVPFSFFWYYLARVVPRISIGDGTLSSERNSPRGHFLTYFLIITGLNLCLYALAILGDVLASPSLHALFFVLNLLGAIGLFWMIYHSLRYEEKPLPYILLALVPFMFVWYYMERSRSGIPQAPSTESSSGRPNV
jgi:hypothetical protein